MPIKTPSNSVNVIGWGINPMTGIMINQLQRLRVQTMASSRCAKKFYEHFFLIASQHCLITSPNSQLTQVYFFFGYLCNNIISFLVIFAFNF